MVSLILDAPRVILPCPTLGTKQMVMSEMKGWVVVQELIRLISVATRNLAMYSQAHPAFQRVLENLRAVANEALESKVHISIQIAREHVLVDGKPLPQTPFISSFASELTRRGIQGITISKGVTNEELFALVELLAQRRTEPHDQRTLERELASRRVTKIFIHAISSTPVEQSSIGQALLRRFLSEGSVPERYRDVLAEYLLSSPRAFGEILSAEEATEGEFQERAKLASRRLITLMEDLLSQRPQEWENFKERLAQVILGMELEQKLSFFQEARDEEGKLPPWLRELVSTLPPGALADILAHGMGSIQDLEERKGFVRSLVPEKTMVEQLMPELRSKLRDYGISPEEFMRCLEEEPMSLDDKLLVFLKGGPLTQHGVAAAPQLAKELLDQGRSEDVLRVVRRFVTGLNHTEWGVRKATAESLPQLLEVTRCMAGGTRVANTLTRFALSKAMTEPDREVFRSLLEVLEGEALGLIERGNKEEGLRIIETLLPSPMRQSLEPSYLAERNERIRRKLISSSLMEQALSLMRGGSEGDLERAIKLMKIIGREAAARIIELLGEEAQVSARVRLLRALRELGEEAIEPMRKALLDPRWYLVRNLVRVLAEFKDPKVLPPILGLMDHPDARVRREAVRALGNFPSSKVDEAMGKALEDPDPSVVAAAIDAIRGSGREELAQALRNVIAKLAGRNVPDGVRIKALRAVAELGGEGEISTLGDVLTRKRLFKMAESEEMRLEAARALARILEKTGSQNVLEVLRRVAKSDPSEVVRKEAKETLERYASGGAHQDPG